MKILKYQQDNYKLLGYKSIFTAYGLIENKDKRKYSIEYVIPFIKTVVKIYAGQSKPIFRNLIILDLLAVIPSLIFSIILGIAFLIMGIISFPTTTLIEKSYLSDTWEFIVGWVWIVLAVYGLIRLFI